MNSRRDYRGSRSSLFDGIEEGINRASSSYSTLEISEHDNEMAVDGLQDKVNILKRITTDIHEEVQSQNKMLELMGSHMDTSRGMLSVTVGRFKKVFEKKRGKSWLMLVGMFVTMFLVFEANSNRSLILPLVLVFVILFFLAVIWRR